MEYRIREMTLWDVTDSFLETLSMLFPAVNLADARDVFQVRSRTLGLTTLVADVGHIVGTASFFIEPKFRSFES